MSPEKILRAIKQRFTNNDIKKLRLFHIVRENGEVERKEISEWNFPKYEKTDLPLLANEVHDIVQDVADDTSRKEQFDLCGYKLKNKGHAAIVEITQRPEKEDGFYETSPEGFTGMTMKFAQDAYGKLEEVLRTQAEMQKDLMASYHKKLQSLEKREETLLEIVREFRELNVDREDKLRKEERFDRWIEVVAGYLAPAAAEKLLSAGLISPEAAAGISAAGKEIGEEIAEQQTTTDAKEEKAN